MRPSKPIKFRVTRDIHAAITDAPVSLSHALRSGILETVPEDILRPAGREDDRTRMPARIRLQEAGLYTCARRSGAQ